jgi:structural maintenance of chromosome 3 (chondroitin sulfate proteoglycan 6)
LREIDRAKILSFITQKKALLNEKMLRKQHDLQINLLEQ